MSHRGPATQTGSALAPGPLFVVSMERAGSSLLYALLNKHPQVALMFEADLVCVRSAFLKPKMLHDWPERWDFFNDALRRHGLTPSDMAAGASDFRSAFRTTHQLFALRRSATIWGDKSPSYHDRLNQIADDFPEARFIIVWRNPKDNANAVLRAASLGNSHFRRRGAVLQGLLGFQRLKKECDRLLARGKSVCQVSFEDLTSETAHVMRQVCDFLQISYDDSLSNLEGADRSAIHQGQHHSNVRGNKIIREPRPEYVDPAVRDKFARYVARWHKLYGTDWPPYPKHYDSEIRPHDRISRMSDAALYRMFRTRDRLTRVAFSFMPISVLRWYRQKKYSHPSGRNHPLRVNGASGAAVMRSTPASESSLS
jgi:Sulfotransferase family